MGHVPRQHKSMARTAGVLLILGAAALTACGSPGQRAPHRRAGKPVVVVAIDLSGSTRPLEANETDNVKSIMTWAETTKAQFALTAIGSTSAAHSAPLVDVSFDVDDGGNPFARKNKQAPLGRQVTDALAHALAGPRGGSDILGAIVAESDYLAKYPNRRKVLAIASDGWNNSDGGQLLFTAKNLSLPTPTLIARAQKAGLVPDLSAITAVYFGGGGLASGDDHPTWEVQAVRSFWLAYFAAAHAPAPEYAPTLTVPISTVPSR